MELTAEQLAIFTSVLNGLARGETVQTVGGYAGTGKTVLTAALADRLPHFAVCALTGKAAHVLRTKGVERAQTIHSLIYHPQEVLEPRTTTGPDGKVKQGFKKKVVYNLREDLGDVGGVLVDEASMVSRQLYDDLCSFGLPLVFVGDHGQLEPVGDDPRLMARPDYRLETIHRNANEIAHFADHLRRGNWASSWRLVPGSGQRVRFVGPDQTIKRMWETSQAIVAFNVKRVEINRQYRAEVLGQAGIMPVAGDRLIVLRNTRRYRIFNGQQVTAETVCSTDQIRVKAEDGRVLDVDYTTEAFCCPKPDLNMDPDAPVPFDFAYAVTAHKGQGSEWDSGLVVEQYCPKWDHARWTYTAATRFKNRLYWTNSKWK